MLRLISIVFSHYNEKARWALDRFQVPYVEQPYMPILHFPAVIQATWRQAGGAGDRASTRFSTPVLVTEGDGLLCDSSDIVRYVSERYAGSGEGLYPTDEVAALEKHFGEVLGPHGRRVMYGCTLDNPYLLYYIAEHNLSRRQTALFRVAFPGVRALTARRLRIHPAGVERSLEIARREFAEVGARLAGRQYLVGERFTAADLAFACMAAALLVPGPDEGYGAVLPPLDIVPRDFRRVVDEFRATEAGQFALRMFREERLHRSLVPHRRTGRVASG